MLPGVTVTNEPVTVPGDGLINTEFGPLTFHDKTVLPPAVIDAGLPLNEMIAGGLGALTTVTVVADSAVPAALAAVRV